MVPRGTHVRAFRVPLAEYEWDALTEGELAAIRRPVTKARSIVRPGQFENLKLETGRALRMSNICEIRIQCLFATRKIRTVTVSPAIASHDLLWIPAPGSHGRREDSKWTLEVLKVDASRLQDVSDSEAACDLGANFIPVSASAVLEGPRTRFARYWNRSHAGREARHRWECNPWVWIIHFRAIATNVDDLLGGAIS